MLLLKLSYNESSGVSYEDPLQSEVRYLGPIKLGF